MLPEKGHTLPLDNLIDPDLLETVSMISAYKLQPESCQKEAMIEFAMRLAASYSRGARRPTSHELQQGFDILG